MSPICNIMHLSIYDVEGLAYKVRVALNNAQKVPGVTIRIYILFLYKNIPEI